MPVLTRARAVTDANLSRQSVALPPPRRRRPRFPPQDVLLLCEDPRKLTCAFQDAWALLEAAGRALAPPTSKARPPADKPRGSARNAREKGRRKAAKELGRVGKRLGYFLLWARSHSGEVAPRMAADVSRALADRSMLGEAFLGDGVEVSPPVRVGNVVT